MEDAATGPQMDTSGEMSRILENFVSDISKMLTAKGKLLELNTRESMRVTMRKVFAATLVQSSERHKLVEEFRKQMTSLIEQEEKYVQRAKDLNEKFQKCAERYQKLHHHMAVSHDNRVKALKALEDEFFKGIQELENHHQQQLRCVNEDLMEQMTALQKKF